MDRLTKLLVIVSNLAALFLLARLVSRGVPPILIPTSAAFAASLSVALVFGDIAVSVVLALTYLRPGVPVRGLGHFSFGFNAIWLAALSGAMLPRSIRNGWAIHRPLKAPLVYWALALALS